MTVGQVIQSAITFLIAAIATYIAYQQWQTNAHKLKLDLFERRYRIYEEARKLLNVVYPSMTVALSDIAAFNASVVEAKFLFGADIQAYIKEISDQARTLEILNSEMREALAPVPGRDRIKIVEERRPIMEWLGAQFDASGEKFKKYLDFTKL
jgi:hypothetical protein